MPHVVILGRIDEAGLEILRRRPDVSFGMLEEPTPERVREALPQADAVVMRPVPLGRAELELAPRLRVVSRHGVGVDTIDVAACTRRGIPVAITVNANRVAVAEHAIHLMLAVAKRVRLYDSATRAGDFAVRERLPAIELAGRTLLVVGFGRIGREAAVRARAFGMRILAFDPHLPDAVFAAEGVERVERLEDGLARADVVSLHAPWEPGTPPLLDRARIGAMREGAILVNTARGQLVDEAALAEALASGRLSGAGIDVFSTEPPPPDHPLLRLPEANVVLSPHAAAWTVEAKRRMAVEAVENALAALDGTLPPERVVNPEALGPRA